MRFLWRWLKRLVFAVILLVLLLLLPVGYTEIACRGTPSAEVSRSIITDPEWQRDESRTLTTYPEWHIVHAYDDYARVIATGDPHDFGYIRAVSGFWTSLCPLAVEAGRMGGFTRDSKMTIYTIGVSFTAELLAKAAYEETLGRFFVWLRGSRRAELDEISARQAAEYAKFLQQTPWYKWDFDFSAAELRVASVGSLRDRERAIALGLEFGAKAAYAGVIESAVKNVGADALRIRMMVTGLSAEALERVPHVTVIRDDGVAALVETNRYRAFTRVLEDLAFRGANVIEIAGNDEIMFTVTSAYPDFEGALHSFQRQGYGDWRHLVVVPVPELLVRLRGLSGARLEHVHDY